MTINAYLRKLKINAGSTIIFTVTITVLCIIWLYLHHIHQNPSSGDAVIWTPHIDIASTIPGRINEINVKENDSVRKGDLLITLDAQTLTLLIEQTLAELQAAKATMQSHQQTLKANTQNAQIANQQVVSANNDLKLAEITLKRLEALNDQGYVTTQQVDEAQSALNGAHIKLTQAKQQADVTSSLIGTMDSHEALVRTRQTAHDIAQHNLTNSKIYAPHDGLVANIKHSKGQVIQAGQSLLTLFDVSKWFALATFPEPALKNIKKGDCATIRLLTHSNLMIKGRVETIVWGVNPKDSISLSNPSPSISTKIPWVRFTQRFPVRIKLISPPTEFTRAGASAIVTVHNGKSC